MIRNGPKWGGRGHGFPSHGLALIAPPPTNEIVGKHNVIIWDENLVIICSFYVQKCIFKHITNKIFLVTCPLCPQSENSRTAPGCNNSVISKDTASTATFGLILGNFRREFTRIVNNPIKHPGRLAVPSHGQTTQTGRESHIDVAGNAPPENPARCIRPFTK